MITLNLNKTFDMLPGLQGDNKTMGEALANALFLGNENDNDKRAKCIQWAIDLVAGKEITVDDVDCKYLQSFVEKYGFVNFAKHQLIEALKGE